MRGALLNNLTVAKHVSGSSPSPRRRSGLSRGAWCGVKQNHSFQARSHPTCIRGLSYVPPDNAPTYSKRAHARMSFCV